VCCLIGDGEANEGAVWEAALLASQHKLNNLTCIIDNNQSGERAVHISAKLSKIFAAFDWEVIEIDGHDHSNLEAAIFETGTAGGPRAIICSTIKGKGVMSMERAPEWHHRSPNPVEYSDFLKELSK
jgi:transketolase